MADSCSYTQSCGLHRHPLWSQNDTHVEHKDPNRASDQQPLLQLRYLASNHTKQWAVQKASLRCVDDKPRERRKISHFYYYYYFFKPSVPMIPRGI